MVNLPESVTLPMKAAPDGAIRISSARVSLDTLIGFYRQGETPEALPVNRGKASPLRVPHEGIRVA